MPSYQNAKFKKGEIVLYKQFDGKVRRVEIVDLAEQDYDEELVKYRIEFDARELEAPEDRLSAIPKVWRQSGRARTCIVSVIAAEDIDQAGCFSNFPNAGIRGGG